MITSSGGSGGGSAGSRLRGQTFRCGEVVVRKGLSVRVELFRDSGSRAVQVSLAGVASGVCDPW